jgi:hypothetical protein
LVTLAASKSNAPANNSRLMSFAGLQVFMVLTGNLRLPFCGWLLLIILWVVSVHVNIAGKKDQKNYFFGGMAARAGLPLVQSMGRRNGYGGY